MPKIIISVQSGIVECESNPTSVEIELHDYDLNEDNNPDRKYGRDMCGNYEITML